MALRKGDLMPEFQLPGSDGAAWSPATLKGQPYVLTFYPKDETPGCIAQMCAFRDAWTDIRATGIRVFGVSRDDLASHEAFVAKRELPFALLTDQSGQTHKALDIGKGLFGGANRVSYLVDAEGKILAVHESNLSPESHAREMLEAARRLVRGRPERAAGDE